MCPCQKWCFQKAMLQIKQPFHFDPMIQQILWIRDIGSGENEGEAYEKPRWENKNMDLIF